MAPSSTITTIAMAALAAALAAFPASAETVSVPAGEGKSLQMFLDLARPGDVLRLAPGEHRGPVTISTTVTVEGEPGAEIVGNGKGSVVTVTAPRAVIRGVMVRGSGTNIPTLDSGIFLDRTAKGAVAENNAVIGNLYGIYIQGADDALVKDNRIEGIREGRSAEAGNGVHLWNAPGAKVIGNDISKGRDGIATMAAQAFRSAFVFNFTFAALAIGLAISGVLLPQHKLVVVAAELVVILLILANTAVGWSARWHERWIEDRVLAERLRHLRVPRFYGVWPGIVRPVPGRPSKWTDWYVRATQRELGLPNAALDEDYLASCKEFFTGAELDPQIAYNRRTHAMMHRLDHRLHVAGLVLFALTGLVCAVFILGYDLLQDLKNLPPRSIVVLHACCHNPTGVDLNLDDWKQILDVLRAQDHVPFIDIAYQGFGDSIAEDAAAVRLFAESGMTFFVSSSFSKSFSLYGERVGALSMVTQSREESARVLSQVKRVIRTNYSNPPTHGATIVSAVLNSPELRAMWEAELGEMRSRIRELRLSMVEQLAAKGAKTDFSFVAAQRGMFSYSGLTAEQVERLRIEFGVYAISTGRICAAALNRNNIGHVTDAIVQVL